MRVYQAGPLFSEAEIQWHRALSARLAQAGHEVVWAGDLVSAEDVAAWGDTAPQHIFATDRAAIDRAEVVVALLDGPQVDDGTAWEIGYAHARNIPVVGIRTDFRQSGECRHSVVNAMIQGSCHAIVRDMAAVVAALDSLADR